MSVVNATREEAFCEFHAERAEELAGYLRGVVGREAEGRGGRVDVPGVLQNAFAEIYERWPELEQLGSEERDRRLYRCLRDAAIDALRAEHGRPDRPSTRRWTVAFDFGSVDAELQDGVPARERELAAAVAGTLAREVSESVEDRAGARATLDRGIFLAGLRALGEREAVVLIAVDHLGWDQVGLAERLQMQPGRLYEVLFTARKLFFGVVRHALGLEIEPEERARLYAYLADELKGRERRLAKRHLEHCASCQALVRAQQAFGERAAGILMPLPFTLAAVTFAASPPASGGRGARAAAGGSGTGTGVAKGLLAQAGASKALAATAGLLTLGVGVSAWLSAGQAGHHQQQGAVVVQSLRVAAPGPPLTVKNPAASKRAPAKAKPHKTAHHKTRVKKKTKSSNATSSSPQGATAVQPNVSPPAPSTPSVPTPAPDAGSGSSGGGGTGGAPAGGGEFFGG